MLGLMLALVDDPRVSPVPNSVVSDPHHPFAVTARVGEAVARVWAGKSSDAGIHP